MPIKKIIILLIIITAFGAGALLFSRSRTVNTGERDLTNLRTEDIAENLEIPWSLAFFPDNSALFTERPGRVRFIDQNENLEQKSVLQLSVNSIGEGGLLGVTIHPQFLKNKFVYIYYTYIDDGGTFNKVERFTFNRENLELSESTVIIDKIPGSRNHNGGRIKFGPDGKLYITTGDAEERSEAQNADSLGGKILRVNDDGSVPQDNPFSGSAVYALGLRNPQGLAWQPETNQLFSTNHGSIANDEINLIVAAGNYGWPEVQGKSNNSNFIDPILESGAETWAPSGMDFYNGDIEKFKGDLFFASLRGAHLQRVILNKDGSVKETQKLFEGQFGRLRDVVFGPDNALYILTSNRDGRGRPQSNDDKIIKINF